MKRILVPTDFSSCAAHAMDAGFKFAKLFGSSLYFLHVLPEGHTLVAERDQELHNTELLYSEWRDKAVQGGVDIIPYVKRGRILDKIVEVVDEIKPDFVIMGSHGASGKKEYFIGSNTQKAVRSIHLPFLIVKGPLDEIKFDKVVFASSFNKVDKDPFKYFIRFMEPFNPEIHLVAINTYNWFSQPYLVVKESMKDFEKLAEGLFTKSHFFTDMSVEAGIRHFSEKIGAELVVVSNLERHPLKRILSGSNVEALVNHSRLPILSIDYPS